MSQSTIALTPKDFKSEVKPTWCPGCGDFGVLNAAYTALAALKRPVDETVVVSGIGCSAAFHISSAPLVSIVSMDAPSLWLRA